MAEADRSWVTAVFATDTVLDAFLDLAALGNGHLHQAAHGALVQRHKRVSVDQFLFDITRDELAHVIP